MVSKPDVLLSSKGTGAVSAPRVRTGADAAIGIGVTMAGAVVSISTLVDVGVLWLAQRAPTAQWEFVAISNTLSAYPGLLLGYALLLLGAWLRAARTGSSVAAAVRWLSILLMILGLAGGGLAALIVTDFFVLRGVIPPEGMSAVTTTTLKAVVLGSLYLAVLLPVGVVQLRRSLRR